MVSSSSGLGSRFFTPMTRVRIPVELPMLSSYSGSTAPCHGVCRGSIPLESANGLTISKKEYHLPDLITWSWRWPLDSALPAIGVSFNERTLVRYTSNNGLIPFTPTIVVSSNGQDGNLLNCRYWFDSNYDYHNLIV